MTPGAHDSRNSSSPRRRSLPLIAKSALAAILAMLGVMLLIATKSAAGISMLLAAVLVVMPMLRLSKMQPQPTWLRAVVWSRRALILALVTLAVSSVANTDLPPEEAKTGYKFIDQVGAIWQRFQHNVFGRPAPPRHHDPRSG